MRWLFRSLLILAFLGLATLAVLPHIETLRGEWQYLQATWQQVRNPEHLSASAPAPAAPNPAEAPERDRSVLKPDAATSAATVSEDAEPFIAEARRRAQTDPAGAMQWLQSEFSGSQRLRGMLEVVALWAANDSENALLWLESNAQGLARLETLNSGIALWSQHNPSAAAAWIDGMANDGSKVSAAQALAANWAQQAPDQAADWVDQLPAGRVRDQAATALIESWGQRAPQAAATWALSQAEFNGSTELLKLSIRQYAQIAPADAADFLRSVNSADTAPSAIDSYIRTRAQSDPVDAMAWQGALSSDDPLNQPDNPTIIMQEWSRSDSVAASTWLNNTQAGPQRDAAIIGFSNTMLEFDPEAAAAWSNTMADPNARLEQLKRSIQQWAGTAPSAALEWLNSTELEPALRTALSTEIDAN
jgi:hypothetical protein